MNTGKQGGGKQGDGKQGGGNQGGGLAGDPGRETDVVADGTADESADSGADPMVILIVDDDPTNLFVLDQFLQGEGYQTITATNGAEAVEMYHSHKPPLVLMDLSMPVMDGFEAAKRIFAAEASSPRPPVVMAVSANVTPEWRSSCLELGMSDFIEKPINFDALIPMISTISADVRAP